jgi:hypothetical protein
MIDLTLTLHTIVSCQACKDFGIQESLSLFPNDGLKKLILKKVFSIFSANFQGWLFSSIYVLPIVPQSDSLFKIFKPDEILKGWNKLSKNFLVVNHHYNDTQLLCMSEKKEKKRTVNIHVCMRHSHFLLVPSLPGVMLFTLWIFDLLYMHWDDVTSLFMLCLC